MSNVIQTAHKFRTTHTRLGTTSKRLFFICMIMPTYKQNEARQEKKQQRSDVDIVTVLQRAFQKEKISGIRTGAPFINVALLSYSEQVQGKKLDQGRFLKFERIGKEKRSKRAAGFSW